MPARRSREEAEGLTVVLAYRTDNNGCTNLDDASP